MGSEFGKFTLKLAEWKKENNQHSANAKAGKPFKATKKPKDEKAPKRPQSAYFLWTASRRAAVKAANPDAKVTEIAKLMGAEWKTLSEAEKKPFVAEAVAQWKRSEKLGKAEADANAPKVSLPRKPKDANKPKAAQTAYFAFTASRRAAISAENPEMKITQIAKLMGAEWKALSEAEKKPFQATAAKSKVAYAAKMEAYKGSAEEKAFKQQLV